MNSVIVWGAGHDYQAIYNLLKFEELKGNIEIIAIADSNRRQSEIDNYLVISSQEISRYNYDFIIISSSRYFAEIVRQAETLGINRDCLIPGYVFQIPCFDFKAYASLKRNPVSIISDDCWGGNVYHYLGLRFDSPFINCYIHNDDFVKMLEDLSYYIDQPLKMEDEGTQWKTPIGSLGEDTKKIYIHFNHCYLFEDARRDFERRRLRINRNNLFIKMSFGWGKYSDETVRKYDNLIFDKKIFLAPFETNFNSSINHQYFLEEFKNRNLENYHLQPRDYIGFFQNIDLFVRHFNIFNLLLTGNICERKKY